MATRTIGTEIVLAGERQFNDAMKGINNNLKNLRADMTLVTAEFDENANSVEALAAKDKALQATVDQHRAKVDALQAMYDEQVKKYGENSAAADKYKQQLAQATLALKKEEAALQKNRDALSAAEKEEKQYIPITQRMANAVKSAGDKVKDFAGDVADGAHHVPVLAEALDVAKVSAKGFGTAIKAAGSGAKTVLGGLGTAAGGVAKGVGAITAASAAGVAAIGAGGVIALTTMAGMAKEAAEAAKEAKASGKRLTDTQKQWLEYSKQLDALDASVANAKGALAGVLLPMLSDLSTEGAAFLNDFTKDMTAAAGDTEKQTQVLSDYIVKGAKLIKAKLPEYIATGKELLSGLAEGLGENANELLDMGLDLCMDLLDSIIEYAPELAQAGIALVQKLTESLIDRGPDLIESAVQMVSQIVMGLAQAAPSLIPAATQLIVELVMALVKNAPLLLEAGLELIYGLISGIFNGIGSLVESADEIIETFVEAFKSGYDTIMNIGKKIIDLIKEGIANAWSSLTDWFNGLWDKLFSGRKVKVDVDDSGSGSPTTTNSLSGMAHDSYLSNLSRGSTSLSAAENDAAGQGKTAAPVKQFNLTIHTQSLSKEDLDMIVSYVNGKLGDDL